MTIPKEWTKASYDPSPCPKSCFISNVTHKDLKTQVHVGNSFPLNTKVVFKAIIIRLGQDFTIGLITERIPMYLETAAIHLGEHALRSSVVWLRAASHSQSL